MVGLVKFDDENFEAVGMLNEFRVMVLVQALVALAMPSVSQAQWWNPLEADNYEDCVIQGMKGVASDDAALAVAGACRRKFPIFCEVVWRGEGFSKGTKPFLGKYTTYEAANNRGWKILVYLPQSKVDALGAHAVDWVNDQLKLIAKICR